MAFAAAVSAVTTAVDQLARADVSGVSGTELRELLKALKVSGSQLEAVIGATTFAGDATGAFIGTGARDTAEWLATETGTSARRNRTASELGEAMERSSEFAHAVTSGELSADKATMIVGAAGDESVDSELIDVVGELALNAVRPAVEEWRARKHPERDADIAATQQARRYVRLTAASGGMTRLDGLLDPEAGAIVRTTLDDIMRKSAFDDTGRSSDQRSHDALAQLCSAASKGQIAGGRSNNKLLAIAPVETITERAALRGRTHVGPTLDAATVRKLACDAGIHRVITGPASSILDFGHETRLVSDNLFHALVVRDQHCRWPGCTIRATWCDAHHIIEWADHGPTNDDNCVLLCHRHHQLSHQPNWSISGNGTELTISRPDGTTATSRPPGAHQRETPCPVDRPARPPGSAAPRVGSPGQEPACRAAPSQQLALV